MRKVPKLRFREFSDKWEECYIKDLVKNKIIEKPLDGNHGNLHPTSSDYIEKGIPFIMANDIINDRIDFKNCKKISKNLAQTLQKGFAKTNDVLLTHKGTLGRTCIVPELNYDYIILTPQVTYYRIIIKEKLKNTFLKNYFNSNEFVKNLVKIGASGTRPYIGILEQLNLKIAFPSIQEQEKIANFLSSIDKKISLIEEKLELFRDYKKGVMQKIFSQELRFKDSEGNDYPEWEEKRLGDYLIKYDEITTKNNQYPVLTSSRKGIFLQKDYFAGQDIASEDTTGYNIVPRGYFTYRHMSDDLIFKFNINNIVDKGIVSTLYPVFTTKNINNYFLKMKLNEGIEFKRYSLLQKQGGSRTYMYFSKLLELKLQLPVLEEQQKIADFLSSIDSKIESIEKELEGLKEFKRGLLQQMFV